jgi:hypothetical protein
MVPATWEAKTGRSLFHTCLSKGSVRPYLKSKLKAKGLGVRKREHAHSNSKIHKL